MKQLLLALVSLFFATSAYSAPITYGFFQGGYDEGAFVAGYFRAKDINHDGRISHFAEGAYPSGNVFCHMCEVVDYFMFFSGSSRVSAFVHSGLKALAVIPEGDIDNLVGLRMETQWSTIPTGEFNPPGCERPPNYGMFCTSFPLGFIGSQDWSIRADGMIDKGIKWTVNDVVAFPLCGPSTLSCGVILFGDDVLARTHERVRIFRIPEPPTIALFCFALAGLAFTRRRRQ